MSILCTTRTKNDCRSTLVWILFMEFILLLLSIVCIINRYTIDMIVKTVTWSTKIQWTTSFLCNIFNCDFKLFLQLFLDIDSIPYCRIFLLQELHFNLQLNEQIMSNFMENKMSPNSTSYSIDNLLSRPAESSNSPEKGATGSSSTSLGLPFDGATQDSRERTSSTNSGKNRFSSNWYRWIYGIFWQFTK